MRVAIVPSLLAPVSPAGCYGGAEHAALALAEALARRGHRVVLVGVAGSWGHGLELLEAPATPAFVPGQAVDEAPGPFPEIFARLRERVDVIHAHFNDPGGLVALDREPGAISTLHLSAVFPGTTAVVRKTTRTRYVAPSRYAASSYGRGDIAVIPNGVDGVELGGGAREGLAWVGRRVPEKGLDAAIAIARRAGSRLHVAGPGPRVESPLVVDHGALTRADVGRLLGRVRATIVSSSIAEAHPLVAIESLLAGTPVVGFAVGGLPEIVDEEVGALVSPGDVAGAVAALGRVSELDPARCRSRALERFSHTAMVEAYEALYAIGSKS